MGENTFEFSSFIPDNVDNFTKYGWNWREDLKQKRELYLANQNEKTLTDKRKTLKNLQETLKELTDKIQESESKAIEAKSKIQEINQNFGEPFDVRLEQLRKQESIIDFAKTNINYLSNKIDDLTEKIKLKTDDITLIENYLEQTEKIEQIEVFLNDYLEKKKIADESHEKLAEKAKELKINLNMVDGYPNRQQIPIPLSDLPPHLR